MRTVQELLGHKAVKTTEIYTHVMNRLGLTVTSPSDRLQRLLLADKSRFVVVFMSPRPRSVRGA